MGRRAGLAVCEKGAMEPRTERSRGKGGVRGDVAQRGHLTLHTQSCPFHACSGGSPGRVPLWSGDKWASPRSTSARVCVCVCVLTSNTVISVIISLVYGHPWLLVHIQLPLCAMLHFSFALSQEAILIFEIIDDADQDVSDR